MLRLLECNRLNGSEEANELMTAVTSDAGQGDDNVSGIVTERMALQRILDIGARAFGRSETSAVPCNWAMSGTTIGLNVCLPHRRS